MSQPSSDADVYLNAAWSICSPERAPDASFPRGFWPDVARVAVELALQGNLEFSHNWRPTMCSRANTEPKRKLDLSLLQL